MTCVAPAFTTVAPPELVADSKPKLPLTSSTPAILSVAEPRMRMKLVSENASISVPMVSLIAAPVRLNSSSMFAASVTPLTPFKLTAPAARPAIPAA